MSPLDACREQYEKDLARQTHCCVLEHIKAEHKAANRKLFEQLLRYQQDIDAKGARPLQPSPAGEERSKGSAAAPMYPENLTIRDPRQLKQILPIPDIHKISDCDLIYRFLIARRMDVSLATSDILHYIGFREKYNLNAILWDREVEAVFNGLDGEELIQQVMAEMAKAGTASAAKVKPTRPLLQAGWAAWNCGVDKRGHVLLYQRPNPKELAMLERRWPHVEGQYDCRHPDFYAVTPPHSNLLQRVYLRELEKGRRLARLLNYNQQYIIREGLHVQTGAEPTSPDTFMDNGGGVTCLIDVGRVKVSHITSSKYKKAFKLFRLLSLMGQSFYPENMNRMIIINGGFIFSMLFKLVRGWLDPQTQQKIVLLSATNRATLEELSSDTHDTPPSHTANSRDESDDDSVPAAATELEKTGLELRDALAEYIHEDFIPSWYGGRLPVVDAPLFYGGSPPKSLAGNPHYAAACQRLRARVVPQLLPDEFLFSHATEQEAVSEEEWRAFCRRTESILLRRVSSTAKRIQQ
ncbi:hypothetical protein LSCM1_06897 [Leishmania martiniquensis]|uniref:CRAL-TRIO domain-containing protein n=1 Tax=Leishmania martiniquensis TaxID=1580590 RepID=A0A836HEX1_9TRYP|nr:hypothetical protein LSCM1_06897 [Leishmania martiniquensis]